jgi:hypothetical protein
VQNAHDAMAHYREATGISFASFGDNSNIEAEID